MTTQLYLSWAWCPVCGDWLVIKKKEHIMALRCPICTKMRTCSDWVNVPLDAKTTTPEMLAIMIAPNRKKK